MFNFGNNKPPKFESFDIAFTKRDSEKVIILKPLPTEEERNEDLGQRYLIRGQDNKTRPIFEGELISLEDAMAALPPKVKY